MIKINQKIPDLELEAFWEGKITKIKLSDYQKNRKWLLLLFYPADFTFVCPTELEEAANYYPKFKEAGVEILSVSTDTVFVHKAWHESSPAISKIKFPMLADPAGKLCREFGTYIDEEGVSLRASFIIDPEGKVVAYEMHDNSIGRSIDELFRKIQAAQFVQKHKGFVCPASWRPGKKAIKINLQMVEKKLKIKKNDSKKTNL